MKTILLTAKHYAIQAKSSEIALEHLAKALRKVKITDMKVKRFIYAEASKELEANKEYIDKKKINLKRVEKHTTIKFSQELDNALNILEDLDITLDGNYAILEDATKTLEEEHAEINAWLNKPDDGTVVTQSEEEKEELANMLKEFTKHTKEVQKKSKFNDEAVNLTTLFYN